MIPSYVGISPIESCPVIQSPVESLALSHADRDLCEPSFPRPQQGTLLPTSGLL